MCRIPVFENVMLKSENDILFSATFPNNSENTILRIIDINKGILSEFNLEDTGGLIETAITNDFPKMIYLTRKDGKYHLINSRLLKNKEISTIFAADVPEYFIEPMALKTYKNWTYFIFRNGIVTYNEEGGVQSADIFPIGEYFSYPPEIIILENYLILRGNTLSVFFSRKYNSLWRINSFLESTGRAIIPIISIILVIIFIQLYRHQKRLLSAVLNLPSSGIVFVIDKNGRLTKANSSGKEILGITNSVPLGKPFQYYSVLEHTKPINELVQKSLSLRETIIQKINISDNENNSKEWYCTALPLRNVAGQYRGIVFTGIDITEELERKRLSNWAQLAHDMQTNLSTIKLNAEQLDFDEEPKKCRKKEQNIAPDKTGDPKDKRHSNSWQS